VLELVAGGFETTQHLIEMMVSHLADHPALWDRLGEDRTLIPKAIEEMLRWRSPVQALDRRAEMSSSTASIPTNSWVTVAYGSTAGTNASSTSRTTTSTGASRQSRSRRRPLLPRRAGLARRTTRRGS
jgi:hypothetical protein